MTIVGPEGRSRLEDLKAQAEEHIREIFNLSETHNRREVNCLEERELAQKELDEKMIEQVKLATRIYWKCIKIAPNDANSWFRLGQLFRHKSFFLADKEECLFSLRKAETYLKTALELQPNNRNIKVILSLALHEQAKHFEGEEKEQKIREGKAFFDISTNQGSKMG